MRFIVHANINDGVPADRVESYVEAEAAAAWKLYEAGIVREVWYREDLSGVVIAADADSPEALIKELNSLPMVSAEIVSLEVISLRPYTGYKALFKSP